MSPAYSHRVWLNLHHLVPYSKGGWTRPENLVCRCSGCHRNVHERELRITVSSSGKLIFRDPTGRRLDKQADLKLAGWMDRWLGWKGEEHDSHSYRVQKQNWTAYESA